MVRDRCAMVRDTGVIKQDSRGEIGARWRAYRRMMGDLIDRHPRASSTSYD